MAATGTDEKVKREACTRTVTAASTLKVRCESGGSVTATFTEECTQEADNCEEAQVIAFICASLKAKQKANANISKVAQLCTVEGGGGSTIQP
ncbi:MAG TPA: hypothetical protein DCQ29_09770 [Chitinophagaceae bacterium]|nr:hypothetical protein [Chitinophagaceae bacterium]